MWGGGIGRTRVGTIGGSRGGTRGARPPGDPNSFIFMQFLAIRELAHPPRENPGSPTGDCRGMSKESLSKQNDGQRDLRLKTLPPRNFFGGW